MSATIWTRCAGSSEIRPLAGRLWRVVEAQHVVSTRRLVDSLEEQALLERLIDGVKPPPPSGPEFEGLHYLLATPFRYPPFTRGSRFARREERGLWYGARELHTAFAEVAYYRLVFLEGTAAALEALEVELTAFRADLRTRRGVDLTAGPFEAHEEAISSPLSWAASQELGREMRAAGVEAFRYRSARDPRRGVAAALFTPRAFVSRAPLASQAWRCRATRRGVEFARADAIERAAHAFVRDTFEVAGRLPFPGGFEESENLG